MNTKDVKCDICDKILKINRGHLCHICSAEYYALKKQRRYSNLTKEKLYEMTRENLKLRKEYRLARVQKQTDVSTKRTG